MLLGVVFRQSDSGFVAILNEMRRAKLTPFSIALLRGAVANPPTLGPSTTKLFAHNEPADRENERRLHELQAAPREYIALDDENKPLARTLRENCIAPTALQLRVGARVMMLKNKEVDAMHLFNPNPNPNPSPNPNPNQVDAMHRFNPNPHPHPNPNPNPHPNPNPIALTLTLTLLTTLTLNLNQT